MHIIGHIRTQLAKLLCNLCHFSLLFIMIYQAEIMIAFSDHLGHYTTMYQCQTPNVPRTLGPTGTREIKQNTAVAQDHLLPKFHQSRASQLGSLVHYDTMKLGNQGPNAISGPSIRLVFLQHTWIQRNLKICSFYLKKKLFTCL